MHMSAAALPPIHGTVTAADRQHPRYPQYAQHRAFCSTNLIEAPSFKDWLSQMESWAERDAWAAHPQYPAFLTWMRAEKGGARKCPGGDAFPATFQYWLTGGRW